MGIGERCFFEGCQNAIFMDIGGAKCFVLTRFVNKL